MEASAPRATMPPKEYPNRDDGGGGPPPAPTIFTHVADSCDSTWHNPACPRSKSSWTGSCTYNASTGKYDCSHT
jgi:hypothetical protein